MDKVIIGFHAIEELIKKKQKKGSLYISMRGKRNGKLAVLAEKNGYRVINSTDAEIERISGEKDHRGIVFLLSGKKSEKVIDLGRFLENFSEENALIVVLDGITDPQNYGAIIRSADQFYADLVIVPARRSAHNSQTSSKVSAGADSYVPAVTVTNISRALEQLKQNGFWIYGAEMSGRDITKTNLKGRTAVILGSEGSGLSRLVSEHCDELVSIPVKGNVDSLNVSVAAGILMYEVRRQQNL